MQAEIWGECDDIYSSLIHPDNGISLQILSQKYKAKIEIFDIENETGNMHHFHYNNGMSIKESPPLIVFDWQVEEEISVDLNQYNYMDEGEEYILKDEFAAEYETEESENGPAFKFEIA